MAIKKYIFGYFDLVMALIFAVPIYIVGFFGSSALVQSIAYLPYILGLVLIYVKNKKIILNKSYLALYFIFLVLWILPNIYNFLMRTLESEFFNPYVMSYHVLMLTIVFLFLSQWSLGLNRNSWNEFAKYLFALLLPFILIFSIKIGIDFYINEIKTPWAFTYRHLDTEFYLIFLFFTFFINSKIIKGLIYFLCLLMISIMSVRAGIICVFIFLIIAYLDALKKIVAENKRNTIYLLVLFLVFILFTHDQLYIWLNEIFLFDSKGRGFESGISSRTSIWISAVDSIRQYPFSGIGYYVRLNPHFDPLNPSLHIHNFFLRIAVENGIFLMIFISLLLMFICVNLIKKQLYWELAVFVSIMFYYFFIPRHIQLNSLSIILYFIVIRSFLSGNIKLLK